MPRLIGIGYTCAAVVRVHAVLVVGELREAVDVLPDPRVGRVEEVRAVDVHLDAGLGVGLGVGVAADVVAAVEHQHLEVLLRRGALRDGQPEEARADNHQISHNMSPFGKRKRIARIYPATADSTGRDTENGHDSANAVPLGSASTSRQRRRRDHTSCRVE